MMLTLAGRVLLAPLLAGFFIVLLPACSGPNSPHEIENHADPNGYRYYTVTDDPTGVRVYTLDNGLTVYLARNTDEPRIRSMIAVRSGAAFDPADSTGVAHYLEHLLFRGTDKIGSLDWGKEEPLLTRIADLYEDHRAEQDERIKKEIYRQIDALSVKASRYAVPGEYRRLASSLGAVAINGYTEYDLTGYWCLFPTYSLEDHLMLEGERFRQPVFRAFQAELEIVYEEYNSLQDSTYRRKKFALDELLFPQHPYGQQSLIGTSEHLKNPSMQAIRTYYDTHYVPGNMAVILVGDLQFDETIQLVDRYFGGFESKPVLRPELPIEPPLKAPSVTTITSPAEESISIGFRLGGAGTPDEKLATLTDLVLNNGFAGLVDVELNAKQTVRRAGSTVEVRNDYSVHYFEGYPNEGQSLEEVRDRILEQIDRIKRGEFEEWLITGAVNEMKKHLIQNQSTAVNLSAECMHSFKRGETWRDRIAFIDEMSKISKQELMDFVTERYATYALVFKRQGPADEVVKVNKPEITPIDLNEKLESGFSAEFTQSEEIRGEPQFVDYASQIATAHTETGVEVAFVENEKNELFELTVIFDMGTDLDPRLQLAAEYCNAIGTDQYSVEELRQRYFELGLTFSCFATADQTMLRLAGLQDGLASGLELLDHFLSQAAADEQAYSKYVAQVLKERESTLVNPRAILRRGLLSYALYGENSSIRNTLTEEELRAIRPEELTELIRGLRDHEHRIFFYGRDQEQFVELLNKHYRATPSKTLETGLPFSKQETRAAVYFVDFDTVQAQVMVVTRGELFNSENIGPSNFYSPYVDHLVFREIRNARALAYSATAVHLMAKQPGDYDYSYVFARTQSDKLPEALDEMVRFMSKLSGTEEDVLFVKEDQLKRYASERITGPNIFWSYERQRRRGIRHDVREQMYAAAKTATRETLNEFFENNIGGRPVSILVVGNRDDIDMKALSAYGELIELDPQYLFNF